MAALNRVVLSGRLIRRGVVRLDHGAEIHVFGHDPDSERQLAIIPEDSILLVEGDLQIRHGLPFIGVDSAVQLRRPRLLRVSQRSTKKRVDNGRAAHFRVLRNQRVVYVRRHDPPTRR